MGVKNFKVSHNWNFFFCQFRNTLRGFFTLKLLNLLKLFKLLIVLNVFVFFKFVKFIEFMDTNRYLPSYIDISYHIEHLLCIVSISIIMPYSVSTKRYGKFIDFRSIIYRFQINSILSQELVGNVAEHVNLYFISSVSSKFCIK